MNKVITALIVSIPLTLSSVNVMAAGPSQHSSQASQHSAQAIAQVSIAGTKVVSGAVSVPLRLIGKAGEISGQAGDALYQYTHTPIGEPLAITNTIVTTPSPDQAMKAEGEK